MQFGAQREGEGDEQEAEDGKVNALGDAKRGELKRADGLSYGRLGDREDSEEQKSSDKKKAAEAGG